MSGTANRGVQSRFYFRAFEDDDQEVALDPFDATFPKWEVRDINNAITSAGIGTLSAPGVYYADFTPADNADLSTDSARWRIDWLFVDSNDRQITYSEVFDVEAAPEDEPAEQDVAVMAIMGKGERISLKLPFAPEEISVEISVVGSETVTLAVETLADTFPGVEDTSFGYKDMGEYHMYVLNVSGTVFSAASDYVALWAYRQTEDAAMIYAPQMVQVTARSMLNFIQHLRMFMDKLQKRIGTPVHITDSDLLAYLNFGMQMVNGAHPYTTWEFSGMPRPLYPFLIGCSALYGLNARHLLETDLAVEFCVDENTLIRTDRGLVKIKDVGGINQIALATELLLTPEDAALFNMLFISLGGAGAYHAADIVRLCNLDVTAQQLGLRFAKHQLQQLPGARFTDHAGSWLWDVSKFWSPLIERGWAQPSSLPTTPAKISTSYGLACGGEVRQPLHVWDMGLKKTYRVRTELGYEEVCTKQHGFLVLDPDTFEVSWKRLKNMQIGDYVAIDATPEDLTATWDVPFENLDHTQTGSTLRAYEYPTELTPALARILGYLVSEGNVAAYNSVGFSNADESMLDQFRADFEACFGYAPFIDEDPDGVEHTRNIRGQQTVFKTSAGTIGDASVELRRFLASVGLGYHYSQAKEVPWCILQAPAPVAAEFLKAFVDGDGCVSHDSVIMCSTSSTLRSQLQSLLLRFGIVSKDDGNMQLTIRGPSLRRYMDHIGLLHKTGRADEMSDGPLYPVRESVPPELLDAIRNIRQLIHGLGHKGYYHESDGTTRRVKTRLRNGNCAWTNAYTKYTTWDTLQRWWDVCGDDITYMSPDLASDIEFLLDTRFVWKRVTSIEKAGRRRVLDPTLPDGDDTLAHAFVANGIVNHNSGQTVSLSYDHTGNIDSAISRLTEWWTTNITPTKQAAFRKSTVTAIVGTRPVRYRDIGRAVYNVGYNQYGDFADIARLLSYLGLTA